jgi:hypothetical protein
MDLRTVSVEYQTLLEHHRADPDDEHIWELLCRARAEVERAWLAHTHGLSEGP